MLSQREQFTVPACSTACEDQINVYSAFHQLPDNFPVLRCERVKTVNPDFCFTDFLRFFDFRYAQADVVFRVYIFTADLLFVIPEDRADILQFTLHERAVFQSVRNFLQLHRIGAVLLQLGNEVVCHLNKRGLFLHSSVQIQFFSVFLQDFCQQHVSAVFIYHRSAAAACFCQDLAAESRNACDFHIHQPFYTEARESIPFCLKGKLIRYQQQRFPADTVKYELVFSDVFTSVKNAKHPVFSLFYALICSPRPQFFLL